MRKNLTKGLVLLPILLLFFQPISGQRWLQTYDFDQSDLFRTMHNDDEGTYIVSRDELVRVDSLGEFLWKTDFLYEVKEAVFRDNDFVTVSNDTNQKRLVAYDYSGTLLWDFPLGYDLGTVPYQTLCKTQGDGFVIVHPVKMTIFNTRLVFEKRDVDGNLLFKEFLTLGDTALQYLPHTITPLSDGTFFSMGYINNYLNNNSVYAMQIDENGNVLWEEHYTNLLIDGFLPAKVIETSDHYLVISGWVGTSGGNQKIVKMTLQGEVVWEKDVDEEAFNVTTNQVIEMPSGNYLYVGKYRVELTNAGGASTFKIILTMIDTEGNTIWRRLRNYFPLGVLTEDIVEAQYLGENKLLMGGYYKSALNNNTNLMLAMTDTLGNIHPHFIGGSVFTDYASDCQYDGSESGFENRVVSFKDGSRVFYAVSDENGQYIANLPGGTYEIAVDDIYYWEPCQATYSLTIDDSEDTTGLDLPMQPTINCALMEVDIATQFLRLCSERYYKVNYCNVGTIEAVGATLEVELADGLTFLSAEIPLLSQNGQMLTFDLGTVNVLECNSFRIEFEVTCDEALFGQTQCTEAHIYPDQPCNSTYTGPILNTSGICQNDTIHFNIINEGGDMQSPQQYIVIEDNIILMTDDFQLLQGQNKTSEFAANSGATYYLVAAQDPNLPAILGNPIATAVVEGCVGEVNEGTFSQFPENDGEPWISVDCHPIIASFDPNDKTAFPSGWREDHFIEARTDLEYLIRFQNTGTDTAFQVVIVDTLSQFLDPSTIRPGAGSHPFSFGLTGQGVATFTFNNILLPDSTTNEAGSHGFVKFSISQKPDNEIGTLIENTGYIYFDYNSAVQTNTVFHTIGEPWVQVVNGSVEVFEPGVQVAVFPNPCYQYATFGIDGFVGSHSVLQLLDINGRTIFQTKMVDGKATVERGEWPAGIYFFSVSEGEKVIATGKLMIR